MEAVDESTSGTDAPETAVAQDSGAAAAPAENAGETSAAPTGNCRVYVGNLPPKATKEELQEAFSECGAVKLVWMEKRDPAKYAFVDFEQPEDAQRAVEEKDNMMLHDQALKVQMSRNDKERREAVQERNREKAERRNRDRENNNNRGGRDGGGDQDDRKTARTKFRVKVTNLGSSVSWQDLKDKMRETGGEVTFAQVKGGEGFAEFATKSDADTAVAKLNGTTMGDNTVEVVVDDVSNRELERDPPANRGGRGGRDDDRRDRRGGGGRRGGRGGGGGDRDGDGDRGGRGGRRQRSRSPPARRERRRSRDAGRRRSPPARRRSPDDRSRRRGGGGDRNEDGGNARGGRGGGDRRPRRDSAGSDGGAGGGAGARSPRRRRDSD